jgi:hypothetical protein
MPESRRWITSRKAIWAAIATTASILWISAVDRAWRAATPLVPTAILQESDDILCVGLTSQGMLLIQRDDEPFQLWDPIRAMAVRELTEVKGGFYALSNGSKDLLMTATDQTIWVTDLATGRSLPIDLGGQIYTASFSSDGKLLFLTLPGEIRAFELEHGQQLWAKKLGFDQPMELEWTQMDGIFSDDGRLAVLTARSLGSTIVDLEHDKILWSFDAASEPNEPNALKFTSDSQQLIYSATQAISPIGRVEARTGIPVSPETEIADPGDANWSASGRYVLCHLSNQPSRWASWINYGLWRMGKAPLVLDGSYEHRHLIEVSNSRVLGFWDGSLSIVSASFRDDGFLARDDEDRVYYFRIPPGKPLNQLLLSGSIPFLFIAWASIAMLRRRRKQDGQRVATSTLTIAK